MIYAQLDPGFPVGFIDRRIILPRETTLFKPLLSAALEWMNVLPLRQPVAITRPRIPVDQTLIGSVAELGKAGVLNSKLTTGQAISAAADLQLSKIYKDIGIGAAGNFFAERAKNIDTNTVSMLNDAAVTTIPATTEAAPVAASPNIRLGRLNRTAFARAAGISSVIASNVETPMVSRLPPITEADRSFGTMVSGKIVTFAWKSGEAPPQDQILSSVYEKRIGITSLIDLSKDLIGPADIALDLPHDYYYVIPLGLAECYAASGKYSTAEGYYLQAANYQYLNLTIEAPYIWQRLVELYLDWGNELFRSDQAQDAITIYERVLMHDGTVPNSTIYTMASLQAGADIGRNVISNLDKLVSGQVSSASLGINPAVVAQVLDIHQQLLKIVNGLDFWGHRSTSVPIWSFEYLQNAAINFAQLAVSAERDFINFQERSDSASLTRQQIEQSLAQANAEIEAAKRQAEAAAAEVTAYNDALTLANTRANNSAANAAEYANTSDQVIMHQALSAQLSGGDSGNSDVLNAYADAMMSGSYRLRGKRGTLAAAEQLTASRLNRQYEIDSLNRQAREMVQAATQAQAELNAANARLSAANAATAVAQSRIDAAQDNLRAFDSQFFTPDVWFRMGQTMWRIYRRYLDMAIHTARLMQQAYNFETDQLLRIIKSDYSINEIKGLMAADVLLADIQSLSYDLITSIRSKPQPIKQTVSLAERYGFAFENQLRKTGTMDFETRIDDFDAYYPGIYAGRIEAVEVTVDGIVPPTGISGTLTNSGISAYRTPVSLWIDPARSGLKYRIQPKETLILSDYSARQDALLLRSDQRILSIFQGAGLASPWRLEIPKAINDIDYGALTDVRITFYYKARYDPDLKERVISELASRPGINYRQLGVPLRWVYPDSFFHFQDSGDLVIELSPDDFRLNERNPVINDIGVIVTTDGSILPANLNVSLTTPTNAAVSARTDTSGSIDSSVSGNPWAQLINSTAIGKYIISLKGTDNPDLVKNGKLVLDPIVNIALILGFSFTSRT